jgi:hypothetical protein
MVIFEPVDYHLHVHIQHLIRWLGSSQVPVIVCGSIDCKPLGLQLLASVFLEALPQCPGFQLQTNSPLLRHQCHRIGGVTVPSSRA